MNSENLHIIPREFRSHPVVQEAERQGYKFNEKNNLIRLYKFNKTSNSGVHGNHKCYNDQIRKIYNKIQEEVPEEKYRQAVENIESQIRNKINNNPNVKINDLDLSEFY